jgi:uncharacterized protein (DUF58 family)
MAAAGLAVAVVPGLLMLWQAAAATLLALAAGDAFAGRRRRGRIAVQRDVPHALPVGTWQTVNLRLSLEAGAATGWLHDAHPVAFRSEGLPLQFTIASGRWLRVSYRISVSERGRQVFAAITLRCASPLRLWLVEETVATRDVVRVFPNFARIAHYTLLATDNRLSQIGILQRRRRGAGMEFQQLRDYRQGRLSAADRLASQCARRPPDLAGIPGRTRPADRVPARLQLPHARSGRRPLAFRPHPERLAAARLCGVASG